MSQRSFYAYYIAREEKCQALSLRAGRAEPVGNTCNLSEQML